MNDCLDRGGGGAVPGGGGLRPGAPGQRRRSGARPLDAVTPIHLSGHGGPGADDRESDGDSHHVLARRSRAGDRMTTCPAQETPSPVTVPTLQDRAGQLAALGWTGREVEWIALVALHSGVFMRSQWCHFFGGAHPEHRVRVSRHAVASSGRPGSRPRSAFFLPNSPDRVATGRRGSACNMLPVSRDCRDGLGARFLRCASEPDCQLEEDGSTDGAGRLLGEPRAAGGLSGDRGQGAADKDRRTRHRAGFFRLS